jgi:flagellar biosynthesis/type III secretory pathway M-ring protein FliF/YscJ
MFHWIKQNLKLFGIGVACLFLLIILVKSVPTMILNSKKLSEEIQFQRNFEEHIFSDVSRILDRIVGDNTYFVSVSAKLPRHAIEEEIINRKPNTFTETRHEKVERKGDFTHEQKGDFSSRKDAFTESDISALSNKTEPRLPGLVQLSGSKSESELPGFPLLTKSEVEALDDNNLETLLPEKLEYGEDPTLSQKDSHFLTRESEDVLVYYNEEKSKKIITRKNIESIFVSVVIDTDSFGLLQLEKEDLEALIVHVAGIQEERGDKLLISYLPFISSPFNLQRFYLKNKPMFQKIFQFLERSQWYILGLILIVIVIWILFLLVKVFKKSLEDKKRRNAEQDKRKEDVVHRGRQKKLNEIEEKQKAIYKLASTKPEEFASLLLNWLEAAERGDDEQSKSSF